MEAKSTAAAATSLINFTFGFILSSIKSQRYSKEVLTSSKLITKAAIIKVAMERMNSLYKRKYKVEKTPIEACIIRLGSRLKAAKRPENAYKKFLNKLYFLGFFG